MNSLFSPSSTKKTKSTSADSPPTQVTEIYAKAPLLWKMEMFFRRKREEEEYKRNRADAYEKLEELKPLMKDLTVEEKKTLRSYYLSLGTTERARESTRDLWKRLDISYHSNETCRHIDTEITLSKRRILEQEAFSAATDAPPVPPLPEQSPPHHTSPISIPGPGIVNFNTFASPVSSPRDGVQSVLMTDIFSANFEAAVAHRATHDAKSNTVDCDLVAYQALLFNVTDWLEGVSRKDAVHWLSADEKYSKEVTAMLRCWAYRCAKFGGLAASFLIPQASAGQDPDAVVLSSLPATIIHSIARYTPALRPLLKEIFIEKGSWILEKAMVTQFQELLIEPWARLPSADSEKPLLVVIDGLERCSQGVGRQVLEVMEHCLKILPICFLVSAAPVKWVADKLDNVGFTGPNKVGVAKTVISFIPSESPSQSG